MRHLIADLMRYHDPLWTLLVPLISLPMMAAGLWVLRYIRGERGATRIAGLFLCATGTALLSLIVFYASLRGSYPTVDVAIPAGYFWGGAAIAFASGFAAATIVTFARRSARSVLLAGSLAASGFSCTVLLGMSGVVTPFALSYDLTAVLAVMFVGSALVGFSLWENGSPIRRHPYLYASLLGSAAIMVLSFGSLSSVLSFREWLTATMAPDDITSSPILVIAIAEAGVVLGLTLVGSLIDNRAAQRDQQEAERLHQMADATFEAVVIHRDGIVIDGNANLPRLLDAPLEEIVGREVTAFLSNDAVAPAGGKDKPVRGEFEIITHAGRRIPVEVLSRPITDRNGGAVVTALRDISERQASQARIRFLAHHDALTELPNRALLAETLEQAVWHSRTTGERLAVLCMDLDGFKLVNDTHGHGAGDDLLRQVAFRIRSCLNQGEFVARVGGDEFVVLQPGAGQPEAAFDLAGRIVACLSSDILIENGAARVGTSIGIAIHPEDAQTPTGLLRHADLALYRAKEEGRGWFRRYEARMSEANEDRIRLERDLRHAEARGELGLVYQPIFGRSGKVACFEALLRWTHPEFGSVPTADFIPLAEERGLIIAIGEWVLLQACRAASAWPEEVRVAVNVSPVQIARSDFPQKVAAILSETGLAPERLELEVTENVLILDFDAAAAVFGRLRDLGVRLVLDDFGVGCSSFAYLHRFPFWKIKLDRTFIMRIEESSVSRSIVRSMIALGREMGLDVTAEGVETRAQLEFLTQNGCHEMQGFLLGRPTDLAAPPPLPEADRSLQPTAALDGDPGAGRKLRLAV